MADVFVSYASGDRARVEPIVSALQARGWSVWWDRAISGGEAFDRAIEQAIDEARCIVVVWSKESVESEWVRTEANEGLARGILVPVAIEAIRPPLAFRRSQTLDFTQATDLDGLIGAVGQHAPRPSSPATALVGREAEVARLDGALDELMGGTGGALLISGEAGVGKTRLTRETVAHARQMGVLSFTGHCSEMEGAPPYEPFVEHMEEAARTIPRDALRTALGENAPEVAKLVPELRQLYADIPEPIALPPDQDRRYLLHGFAAFLERAAAVQPMLLVFEDLHWADDSTCIMLRHLASRLAHCPVLLLGTYRDNELAPSMPFARTLQDLVRERLCLDVNLKRLGRQAVAELLASRAGAEAPEALVDAVFSETEGNPFFVEEVYRNLEESGRLFGGDGQLRADVEISDTDVPRGVRLVLEQRLGRVSEAARKALTSAAVAGRQFGFDLLLRVAELDEDTLLDVMDEASAASLVEDVSTGRDARYRFAHELIRQTLLAGLSLPRRQRVHLRIGEALVTLGGDARVTEIAHHFYQAGAAADAEVTVDYLLRAGRRAVEALAFEDALAQLDLALETVEESAGDTLADIQRCRARALRGSARIDDALAAYDAALTNKLPDAVYEAVLRERARLHVDMYAGAEALPDIEELLRRAKDRNDARMELDAQLLLAEARYRISLDTPEAQEPARVATERAIQLAREVGDQRALAEALLGSTHFVDYWREYRETCQRNLREARQIGEALGDEEILLDVETFALRINVFTPMELNVGAAEEIRRRLVARRDPIRLREHLFCMITHTRARALLERCLEVCEEAIAVADQLGVPPIQYPTFKGMALLDLGRCDEAWRSIEQEPTDEPYRFARAVQRWGFLTFKSHLGDAEAVLAEAPDLFTEAHTLGRAWMMDAVVNLVARSGARAGLVEETERFLAHAFEATETRPYWVERGELALAKGDAEQALTQCQRAADYTGEHGMVTAAVEATEALARALVALERWDVLVDKASHAIEIADGARFARLQWPLYAARAMGHAGLGDAERAAQDKRQAQALFECVAQTIGDRHIRACYGARAHALGLTAGAAP